MEMSAGEVQIGSTLTVALSAFFLSAAQRMVVGGKRPKQSETLEVIPARYLLRKMWVCL